MRIRAALPLGVALASCVFCSSVCPGQEQPYQAVYGHGSPALTVATGSPGELGLLAALAAEFNRTHDASIRWRKAGSGAALKLLKDQAVDVVLVHAPEAEQRAVAEGWAAHRTLVGANEFYLVGPKRDPAGIAAATTATDALARIARARASFFSRGDNSGTHNKEMAIWQRAGIEPSGDWYLVANDFMLAALKRANEEQGYFLTDSSTWVTAQKQLDQLAVLFQGDPALLNIYHGLARAEPAQPGQASCAEQFLRFLATPEAQAIVRSFGVAEYGEPLYRDAEYAARFAR